MFNLATFATRFDGKIVHADQRDEAYDITTVEFPNPTQRQAFVEELPCGINWEHGDDITVATYVPRYEIPKDPAARAARIATLRKRIAFAEAPNAATPGATIVAAQREELRILEAEAVNVIPGVWKQDWTANDGSQVWTFYTEDAEKYQEWYVDVSGHGPFTWSVGEAFPGGRTLRSGRAEQLEDAQQVAVVALATITH